MKAISLPLLMLSLLTVNVMASPSAGLTPWGEPLPRLAQMSREERQQLQLRWERLSPEEQALLRQRLREQLADVPPEQREYRRREIIEGWREQPGREREYRARDTLERRGFQTGERYDQEDERGFGRGFERRIEPREGRGRR